MRTVTRSANFPRFASLGGLLCVTLVTVVFGGCTWQPKMFHPNAFDSGRVLRKGQAELAVQTLGAGINYGFGAGFEGQLTAAFDGDEIGGVELALKRCLSTTANSFASGMVGVEWFDAAEHDFSGHRFVAGLTGSVYTQNGRFGLHLPLKVYYMRYDYRAYNRGDRYYSVEDRDDGAVFVPGIGLSVEGKHVTFRVAGNLPMREDIGRVEMLPFFGLRLGVKF